MDARLQPSRRHVGPVILRSSSDRPIAPAHDSVKRPRRARPRSRRSTHWTGAWRPSKLKTSKLTAPDFDRLARTPCPIASLASSGIKSLLKELPPAGDIWPDAKRKLWLDTASSIFKIIYEMTRPPTEAAQNRCPATRRGVGGRHDPRAGLAGALCHRGVGGGTGYSKQYTGGCDLQVCSSMFHKEKPPPKRGKVLRSVPRMERPSINSSTMTVLGRPWQIRPLQPRVAG